MEKSEGLLRRGNVIFMSACVGLVKCQTTPKSLNQLPSGLKKKKTFIEKAEGLTSGP